MSRQTSLEDIATAKNKGSQKRDGPLFTLTGNPFVDTGLAVLCVLTGKSRPEEIIRPALGKQIEYISNVYVHKDWKRHIHGLLFPNSELANPSLKDGPARYKQLLEDLFEKAESINGTGNCSICGRRDGLPVNKTRVPLFGSKKFINFFPGGLTGERVCPNCLLAIQFFMLGIEKVGRPLMLHSPSWTIQMAYVKRIVQEIKRKSSAKEGGLADFDYTMQAGLNAAYDTIMEIVQERKVKAMPAGELVAPLRFYHFTNYGQGPDLTYYDIPSSIFEFLLEITKHNMHSAWREVVKKGYPVRKKNPQNVEKRFENSVYRNLTENKSIVGYFFGENEFEIIGDWGLMSFYLQKVRNMDQKRINAIRDVADRFFEFCKKTGSAKRILQLHYARSYHEFRSILLKVQEQISTHEGQPLLTFDEYVLDLAPEGGRNWRETRDLLLFRIYEQGASWLSSKKEELEAVDEDDETVSPMQEEL
ncbi:MAG: type I-B CRISPR-associated protein Cas8b1/Cst1 [Candidatus Thorarchaeota archaeon]